MRAGHEKGTNMELSIFLILGFVNVCNGYLKFAIYYQDHMVLQRGPQSAIISGVSGSNSGTVTVEVTGPNFTTVSAKSDPSHHENNMWKVKLPPITEPGPFTVTASDTAGGKISIKDVLFGDVWVCSGQSNMYFPISWLFDPQKTINDALKFKDIRIFQAKRLSSNTPKQVLNTRPDISWTGPTHGSLPNFSALCWLYAQYLYPHRNYPLGMVESSWGGTSIEAWSSPDSLSKCPVKSKRGPHEDNVLWNAMMLPFTSMTIYGVIWYQGEANTPHPERYRCEFPAMIADWREKFHQGSMGQTSKNFPFGFVQLAPNTNSTMVGGTPLLRWAQTAYEGQVPNNQMPNTFMAVAMDLPDYHAPHGSIHPRYKEDVAERLVLSGRAVAYGETGVDYQGPFPSGFKLNSQAKTLTVEYNGAKNIAIRNNQGFEICCSWTNTNHCQIHDHWEPVQISSHTQTSLTLPVSACGDRRHFVGLRYEWHTSPCDLRKCAVYDSNLPGPSFIRAYAFEDTSSEIIG